MDKNSNDVNPAPQPLNTSVKQDTDPIDSSAQNKQEVKKAPEISKVVSNSNADGGAQQPPENRVFHNSAAEPGPKTLETKKADQ